MLAAFQQLLFIGIIAFLYAYFYNLSNINILVSKQLQEKVGMKLIVPKLIESDFDISYLRIVWDPAWLFYTHPVAPHWLECCVLLMKMSAYLDTALKFYPVF